MKKAASWLQKKIRKRVGRMFQKNILQKAQRVPEKASGRFSSPLKMMVARELAGDSRWFDAHLVMRTIPETQLSLGELLFSAGLLEKMYYTKINDPDALGWMDESLRLKLHVCRQEPGNLALSMATAGTLLVMGKVGQAISLMQQSWGRAKKPAPGEDLLLPIPQGIGHLTNLDYLFKMKELGLISFRKAILPLEPNFRINHEFLSYWIPFGVEPVEAAKLQKSETLRKLPRIHPDLFAVIHGKVLPMYHAVAEVEKSWVHRGFGPLLHLKKDHHLRGWQILQKYGCPKGSWFVTLHVRESGFTGETDVPPNDHRNSNVETFLPAIQFLTSQGGWVVRIGDPTMRRLSPMENVIDYAHDPNKEEFMDLFLCSENLFYLGTSSGPCMIPPAFGKKCAIANLEIIGGRPFYFGNIFIPKILANQKDDRILTFPDAMARKNKYCFHSNVHYADGLRFIDNQEDEIRAMAEEMWKQETGQPIADPEAGGWQDSFDQLGREYEATYGTNSRISAYFIRKYRHLLT